MFDRSKLESLRDESITRIGDTFPTVFRRLSGNDLSLLKGCLDSEREAKIVDSPPQNDLKEMGLKSTKFAVFPISTIF